MYPYISLSDPIISVSKGDDVKNMLSRFGVYKYISSKLLGKCMKKCGSLHRTMQLFSSKAINLASDLDFDKD